MKITEIKELIQITNLINHKYVTADESFKIIELNESLIKIETTFNASRIKVLESLGATKTPTGTYTWKSEQNEAINQSIFDSELIELEEPKTHVLSKDSMEKLRQVTDFNTIQLRAVHKHLLINE